MDNVWASIICMVGTNTKDDKSRILTLAIRSATVAWHPVPVVLLDLESVVEGKLLPGADVRSGEEDHMALTIEFDHLMKLSHATWSMGSKSVMKKLKCKEGRELTLVYREGEQQWLQKRLMDPMVVASSTR